MAKAKKKEVLSLEEKLEQALVPVEEWPYEVPENWCWIYLQAICTVPITDGTHKTPTYCDKEEGVPFISAKDVTGQHINWDNIKYITKELHEELYERIAPRRDDILLAKNGTTGVAALVETDKIFDIYVTLALLRIDKRIVIPKYMLYLINSPICKCQFDEHLTGIGVPNLHLRDIKKIKIPLPPIAEQQRIVEQIESLFSKLDEAKENLLNVINSFSERKSVILNKAFKGELTAVWRERNGVSIENWEHKKFSDLCNIVRGGSPRPAGSPEFYDGTIPFMKVADITGNRGPYVSKTEHTIKEAGLRKTRMVEANTLLLTNSGATLGVPAITTIQTTFNDGIAAFLDLKEESLLFYYYFWKSKISELRAINKGAAQPNLNTTIIGEMEIDVPSIAEQQEIVKILQNLIEKEENVKEIAENMVEQISLMKKSILAKAFRGELGTNNPDEEKAIELLKQIIKGEKIV